MENQCRNEIEHFCRDFFKGNNIQLYKVIDNYKHLLADINIQQMNLTQDTFSNSFKSICKELFRERSSANEYIIALLGFALKLNEYHCSYSFWYHDDILIDSLSDVLEEINFQPKELIDKQTYCIIL